MTKRMPVLDRLFSKAIKSGECLVWQGYTNIHGYGVAKIDGKVKLVHREVYERLVKKIPVSALACDRKIILHSCDNRACIEITHMSLGTDMDNVHDRMSKDRSYQTLTNADRAEIKRLLSIGAKGRRLANRYGVTESRISQLKTEMINDQS